MHHQSRAFNLLLREREKARQAGVHVLGDLELLQKVEEFYPRREVSFTEKEQERREEQHIHLIYYVEDENKESNQDYKKDLNEGFLGDLGSNDKRLRFCNNFFGRYIYFGIVKALEDVKSKFI